MTRAELLQTIEYVHKVLCETRTKPTAMVGGEIEWCIDHLRAAMDTPESARPSIEESKESGK